MPISQFSRSCSLYDIIVTSYINELYLFWYQWKEDIHSYTLVVNLGLYMTFNIDNPRGCSNNPTSENLFGKNAPAN